MLLRVACVLGLLAGAAGTGGVFESSVSDALRAGAAVVSRLLRQGGPGDLLSPLFPFAGPRSRKVVAGEEEPGRAASPLVPVVLGLLGVDSAGANGFALDAFISLLHLMSAVMTASGRADRRRGDAEDFSPFRFVLGRPQVARLLRHARDPAIVELLLEESRERLRGRPPEDAECVLLLVCKTKPFVGGMQRSLDFFAWKDEDAAWEKATPEDRMFHFVPGLEDVVRWGDECDRRFPGCVY